MSAKNNLSTLKRMHQAGDTDQDYIVRLEAYAELLAGDFDEIAALAKKYDHHFLSSDYIAVNEIIDSYS